MGVLQEYQKFQPSDYDKPHGRFLRLAGGEGQSAVEGAVAALLRPGLRVLDAGCGTGKLARRLTGMEKKIDVTLLDASPRLLRATRDIAARPVHGSILDLPFPPAHFDLSLALWVIEATGNAARAIGELVRVTRKDGHLCILFCARKPHNDLVDRAIKWGIRMRGTGEFLDSVWVETLLADAGVAKIQALPCHGPAAAYLVKR